MCVALYTNFKKKDKDQGSGDNASVNAANLNAAHNTQVEKVPFFYFYSPLVFIN